MCIAWELGCLLVFCVALSSGWAVSPAEAATPDALTSARQTLTSVAPAVLAPSQPTQEGGVQVDPRLVAAGGGLVSAGSFAKATLPTDLSGPVVVPSGGGTTISMSLASGSAKAAPLSDASAAYVSKDGSTVVVRPSAVGLQVFEALPTQAGVRTFTWTLSLPKGQRLVAIDDQTAAVVAAPPPALENPADSQAGQPAPPAPAGTPSVPPSSAQPVIQPKPESAFEPARLITDADAQVRIGLDELERSQRLADEQVVAVVRAPWARGPGGTPIPTSIQVTGPSAISIRVDAPTAPGPVVAKQDIFTSDALSRAQEAVLAQRYPGVQERLDWRLPSQNSTPPSAPASSFFTYYWFSGISDSYFAPDSPSAQALLTNNPAGIRLVRAIVAWNAELAPTDPLSTPNARAELARFESWYQAALRAGDTVVVAFHGDKGLRTPTDAPQPPPTSLVYNAAVAQFLALHPQIKYVSAWNEPNYSPPDVYQSPNADQAERYLAAVAYMCGGIGCNVIAGDFAGETGGYTAGYIQDYYLSLDNNNPGFRPTQWAFHDYGDVRGYQQGGDRSAPIAHAMDGLIQLWAQWIFDTPVTVWNAESGALYRQLCSEITKQGYTCNSTNSDPLPNGELERNWGQHSQRDAAAFVLELANVDPAHILVTLYYNYQSGGCVYGGSCTADAFGLIGSSADPFSVRLPDQAQNGQRDLAYCIIRDRITVDDPRRAALNAC